MCRPSRPPLTPAGPYNEFARALAPAWFDLRIVVAVSRACLIVLMCAMSERPATAAGGRELRLASIAVLALSTPVVDWIMTTVVGASPLVTAWIYLPRILIWLGLAEVDPGFDDEWWSRPWR